MMSKRQFTSISRWSSNGQQHCSCIGNSTSQVPGNTQSNLFKRSMHKLVYFKDSNWKCFSFKSGTKTDFKERLRQLSQQQIIFCLIRSTPRNPWRIDCDLWVMGILIYEMETVVAGIKDQQNNLINMMSSWNAICKSIRKVVWNNTEKSCSAAVFAKSKTCHALSRLDCSVP